MKTAAVGTGALALGPTAKALGANAKARVAFTAGARGCWARSSGTRT